MNQSPRSRTWMLLGLVGACLSASVIDAGGGGEDELRKPQKDQLRRRLRADKDIDAMVDARRAERAAARVSSQEEEDTLPEDSQRPPASTHSHAPQRTEPELQPVSPNTESPRQPPSSGA